MTNRTPRKAAFATVGTALALSCVVAAPHRALAQSASPELGLWINHTGKGAIETYLCGSNLCGRIVWLKEPNFDNGKPKTDGHNPDPGKRKRAVCGLVTLSNLKRMQGGGWGDGAAYNPEEGKSYNVAVRLADSNTLNVTGSMLFFSKTVVWKRAKGQLQRCDAKPAAPPPAPAVTAQPAAPPAAARPTPAAASPAPVAPAPVVTVPDVTVPAQAAKPMPVAPAGEPQAPVKPANLKPVPAPVAQPSPSALPAKAKVPSAPIAVVPAAAVMAPVQPAAPATKKAVQTPSKPSATVAQPAATGQVTAVPAPATPAPATPVKDPPTAAAAKPLPAAKPASLAKPAGVAAPKPEPEFVQPGPVAESKPKRKKPTPEWDAANPFGVPGGY